MSLGYYNVMDYGALGNGSNDDTSYIQAAINAAHSIGGGVVFFPSGTYCYSKLALYNFITILGCGDGATTLTQIASNVDGLSGVDLTGVSFRDFRMFGSGSGTGKGINLTRSNNAATPYLQFSNLTINGFGSDGIALSNPIVTDFSRVVSVGNGGYGFNLYGTTGGAAGTSVSMNACYGNGNVTGGYRLYNMVYSSLNGCAADSQPISYFLDDCQSITISGSGSEGNLVNAFKINGGYGINIQGCWVADNNKDGIYITGGAHAITLIGTVDNSPHSGATSFIKTDAGTKVVLLSCVNVSPNNLASGTTRSL